MSLQTKFTLVLGLLSLVVVVSLGTALAFGRFLQRELVWPLENISRVMGHLGSLKRANDDQIAFLEATLGSTWSEHSTASLDENPQAQAAAGGLPPLSAQEEELEAFAERRLAMQADLDRLETDPAYLELVGASTARNLRMRVASAGVVTGTWLESADREAAVRAADALRSISDLIERIESRLLADSSLAVTHGSQLRRIHSFVIASGAIASLLFGLLGVMLVRRWVVMPVSRLRQAAIEIGRGNLSYRIPIPSDPGRDELLRLSAEVNQMAGLISRMQEEAVERERLASTGAMVRRLAHNIRNPLAGIRALAELSRKRAPEDSPIRRDQEDVIRAIDRFNQWLTELLDATSPLEVRPAMAPTVPWLADIADSQRPLAAMRSVSIETDWTDAPAEACFDHRKLEHAVVAVATNAIQASPPGGTVRLVAGRLPDGQSWFIRIDDQGPGIPPEIRDKIFRPYFTTKRDGNGIGLAVAQQVVKAHGGEIRVETAVGTGTAFTIVLPVGPFQPLGGAPTIQSAENSRLV